MDEIFDKLKELTAEQLGVDEDAITTDTTFEDLDADSLDMVELMMAIEEEFDIEIPDEDSEKLTNMEDAVSYISERI